MSDNGLILLTDTEAEELGLGDEFTSSRSVVHATTEHNPKIDTINCVFFIAIYFNQCKNNNYP
ncbi:hypothetical protein ATB96_16585 [Elizabethkingia ursingii]|nr:hypothetical protein ATB96_16585 [Elizabethkingia ursingii]